MSGEKGRGGEAVQRVHPREAEETESRVGERERHGAESKTELWCKQIMDLMK